MIFLNGLLRPGVGVAGCGVGDVGEVVVGVGVVGVGVVEKVGVVVGFEGRGGLACVS